MFISCSVYIASVSASSWQCQVIKNSSLYLLEGLIGTVPALMLTA